MDFKNSRLLRRGAQTMAAATGVLLAGAVLAGAASAGADTTFDAAFTQLDGWLSGSGGRVAALKSPGKPIMPLSQARLRLAELDHGRDHKLTPGQKALSEQLLAGKSGFVSAQGVAGTGKTTSLKSTLAVLEAVGRAGGDQVRVFGIANTKAARDELKASGVEARTTASFLNRFARFAHAGVMPKGESQAEWSSTVLFVDETSFIGNSETEAVLAIANRLGVRSIVASGDIGQLPSLKAGNLPDLVRGRFGFDVEMADIVRQRDPNLKTAVEHLAGVNSAGKQIPALDRSRGAVAATLILAHGNGRLPQFEVFKTGEAAFAVGDRVRILPNDPRNLADAMTGLRITGEHRDGFEVTGQVEVQRGSETVLEDKTIFLPAGSTTGMMLDHDYSRTVYSAQGTSHEAVIAGFHSESIMTTLANLYIIGSRATDRLSLVTDNLPRALSAAASNLGLSRSALAALEYNGQEYFHDERDKEHTAEKDSSENPFDEVRDAKTGVKRETKQEDREAGGFDMEERAINKEEIELDLGEPEIEDPDVELGG